MITRKKFRLVVIFSTLFIIISTVTSCGPYRDYRRGQAEQDAESKGRQILLQAESEKKALIEEAKAKNEASRLEAETKITIAKANAQAEIERARGVAEANKIIGESLKGNSEYLRYLWVTGLHDDKGERIYIPTEAGLPILEAK